HRPQVHVLLEPLSNRKEKAPEADVIGDRRPADRAEVDRIKPAQDLEAVVRHHLAGLVVVGGSPGERREFQLATRGLDRFEALGDHLGTDAVARNNGDALAHLSIFTSGAPALPESLRERLSLILLRAA